MHIIYINAPRVPERISSKNTFKMTKNEKCMSESHTFQFLEHPQKFLETVQKNIIWFERIRLQNFTVFKHKYSKKYFLS